jgi:hypothetical protein
LPPQDNEREGFPITACREILLLSRLDHPNVVRLVEVVTSPVTDSVFMVLEYMDHDLAGLADRPGLRFSAPQVKCIMRQVLHGLAYCHDRGVLHRDLKASNVLVDNTGTVKLADFGLARRTASLAKQLAWTARVITLWYRPPELLLGAAHYGPEVDCWSVGCIMAELILGRPLFAGTNETEQIELIYSVCGSPSEDNWPGVSRLPYHSTMQPVAPIRRRLREALGQQPQAAVDLLEGFLTLDPGKRISAERAASHAYFRTQPLPCAPHQLPQVEPCHELQMKRRRQAAKAVAQAEAEAEQASRAAAEEERRKAGAAPQPPAPPPPPPPPQQQPAFHHPPPTAHTETLGMGWRAPEAAHGMPHMMVMPPAGPWGPAPVVAPSVAIGGWGWHAPPADQRHYAAVAAAEAARRHHMSQVARRAQGAARLLRKRPAAAPARLYPLRELLDASPSRADGVSVQQEAAFRHTVVRFLEDVAGVLATSPPAGDGSGAPIRVPRPVIATACVFAHRFYARNSCAAYENRCHVVGAACLLLACKVDAAPRTLADIVCASYRLRTNGGDLLSEQHKPNYPRERDNVLDAERRLVRALGFHFHVTHALDYLVPAAARLRELSQALAAPEPPPPPPSADAERAPVFSPLPEALFHAEDAAAEDLPPQEEGELDGGDAISPQQPPSEVMEPLGSGSPLPSPIGSMPGSPVSGDEGGGAVALRRTGGSAGAHAASAPPALPAAFDAAAVMRAAVSFANDSLQTLLCLQYESHLIAGGCLALACRLCGCANLVDNWHQSQVLDCALPETAVLDVMGQMVDSYRQLGHTHLVKQLTALHAQQGAPPAAGMTGHKRGREGEEEEEEELG